MALRFNDIFVVFEHLESSLCFRVIISKIKLVSTFVWIQSIHILQENHLRQI